MLRVDPVCFAGDGEPFGHIMEFPDVARPGVASQEGQGVGGDAGDAAATLDAGLLQKALKDRLDVLGPFTERRQAELIYVEPVVEVEPEAAGFTHRSVI